MTKDKVSIRYVAAHFGRCHESGRPFVANETVLYIPAGAKVAPEHTHLRGWCYAIGSVVERAYSGVAAPLKPTPVKAPKAPVQAAPVKKVIHLAPNGARLTVQAVAATAPTPNLAALQEALKGLGFKAYAFKDGSGVVIKA